MWSGTIHTRIIVLLSVMVAFLLLSGCADRTSDDLQAGDPWDSFSIPNIDYINRDAEGNGQIFDAYITDPLPHVQAIAKNVSMLLYHTPEEVPGLTKITLIIDDFDGVAWKSGDRPEITIAISSQHLLNVQNSGADVLAEIDGILYHEITHGYQYDDGGRYGELSGVIEGVADTVRLYAGYVDPSARHHGGNWNSGYKTTAFFFAWLEAEKYPDFLYLLNQSLIGNDGIDWSWDWLETLTGETVESLWQQYQQSF